MVMKLQACQYQQETDLLDLLFSEKVLNIFFWKIHYFTLTSTIKNVALKIIKLLYNLAASLLGSDSKYIFE